MADTKAAVQLSGIEYQSANTLSGIAVGAAISVQNQTTDILYFAISATKPTTAFVGEVIPADVSAKAYVSALENEVWLLGKGPVSIQEI